MSEEHLANKSQPPPALPDAEYDLIYATVSETAQGRRFLEEYARRCRPSDTELSLAAIERMQQALRAAEGNSSRFDLMLEMAEMAQAIARVRAEIVAIKPVSGAMPADAMEDLDSIVHMTESATSRILAAVERMQEIAWTLRESGANSPLCDELDVQAGEIYAACSFQDTTGQRTRKAIQVLRYLEDRINAALAGQETEPAPSADSLPAANLAQAGVDAVMQQPDTAGAETDRQDATLEDISRVMLAIEPMIFHQSADDEPVEQVDANIEHAAVADVRPELSVAETVTAEADTARDMAEWAVEPKTPMQPPPETQQDVVEWVVEDANAPRPDSEPAWMILHRMEAELDEQAEAEPRADVFQPAPPIPPVPAVLVMAESVVPPPASLMAEPAMFVAESMAQLATTLRPVAMLPPPELTFRSKLPSTDALTELQTAMEAAEMKLAQPGDDTDAPEAPIPPPSPEELELLRRLTPPAPPVTAPAVEAAPAEPDTDDFLFASEDPAQTPAPAAITPAPQGTQEAAPLQASAEEPEALREPEWENGAYPHPALVTPQIVPEPETQAAPEPKMPPQGEPQPQTQPSHDPLAPLRALSEAQKIALFS